MAPSGSPDDSCPEAFVALAERVADAAARITLTHFRRPLAVETKADTTPVTAVDREAEAAMRALIAAEYPEHGVLGEEQGEDRRDAEHLWILDPIDGTSRFVSGHVQFGVLVGLLRRGRPVLGVIEMPALEERWIGAAGRATRHRDRSGEREAQVRPCAGLADAVLYATTPHMFEGPDHAAFERVRTRVRQPTYGGECYAYGLLSSGFVDLVVEADMDFYDFLPLVPVVAGAGGRITDWQGAELGLDSDGRILAAGDMRCHEAARLALRG